MLGCGDVVFSFSKHPLAQLLPKFKRIVGRLRQSVPGDQSGGADQRGRRIKILRGTVADPPIAHPADPVRDIHHLRQHMACLCAAIIVNIPFRERGIPFRYPYRCFRIVCLPHESIIIFHILFYKVGIRINAQKAVLFSCLLLFIPFHLVWITDKCQKIRPLLPILPPEELFL